MFKKDHTNEPSIDYESFGNSDRLTFALNLDFKLCQSESELTADSSLSVSQPVLSVASRLAFIKKRNHNNY